MWWIDSECRKPKTGSLKNEAGERKSKFFGQDSTWLARIVVVVGLQAIITGQSGAPLSTLLQQTALSLASGHVCICVDKLSRRSWNQLPLGQRCKQCFFSLSVPSLEPCLSSSEQVYASAALAVPDSASQSSNSSQILLLPGAEINFSRRHRTPCMVILTPGSIKPRLVRPT